MGNRDRLNGGPRNQGERRLNPRWARIVRLLYPGVGLKRWLLVGALGVAAWSVGVAFISRRIFEVRFPEFLPSNSEGFLLIGAGILATFAALYGMYRSVGSIVFAARTFDSLADTIYIRRSRGRGPRIVAIGGGTGLSVLLRGLKAYTDNLTAIITVGDDGGSSGRLRRELGVLPPGDFRNCLVAMSEEESLLTDLFQYRFDQGNGLKGHSFGNLFIVAMTNVTHSFQEALSESSKVLAVHGQIVPATEANLRLSARFKDGTTVHGESSITGQEGEIDQLFIDPLDANAYPLAVEAIEQAQLVVIGPGSLYTSILPNLLVGGVSEALRRCSATKIYVCNVVVEKGETENYSIADHVRALQRHTFPAIVDYVVADDGSREPGPEALGTPVVDDGRNLEHAKLERADVADETNPIRHDPEKLARIITELYQSRGRSRTSAKRGR